MEAGLRNPTAVVAGASLGDHKGRLFHRRGEGKAETLPLCSITPAVKSVISMTCENWTDRGRSEQIVSVSDFAALWTVTRGRYFGVSS